MTNMNITSITIDSCAYPEFIDSHSDQHANNSGIAHSGNLAHASNTPSLGQVLILDHIAMLLKCLKSTSSHGVAPQDNVVDDKDIVARINDLLESYRRY